MQISNNSQNSRFYPKKGIPLSLIFRISLRYSWNKELYVNLSIKKLARLQTIIRYMSFLKINDYYTKHTCFSKKNNSVFLSVGEKKTLKNVEECWCHSSIFYPWFTKVLLPHKWGKKHKLQMNWRSQPSLYSTSYIWKIMISVLRNGGMCPPSTDATPFQLK
jgi:hypothetical protein